MREWILLVFCVAISTFIGWNILYLISGRGFSKLYVAERLGLACLLGFGFISLQMFIVGRGGVRFTRTNLLFPWFFVVAATAVLWRMNRGNGRGRKDDSTYTAGKSKNLHREQPFSPSPFGAGDFALIVLIVAQTLYNFFRALIAPIESYDAVAIYGLKSKMIYLAGTLSGDFFKSLGINFHGAHADYPLLIPLSETWVYTFLGNLNDILVKIIFPLFYLSFLFIFFSILKRITRNRTVSLAFTFLLASIKQFSDYSTIAVADLALGIYFAVAMLYLYLWFEQKDSGYLLNISLAGVILCLWTKNEGTLLALVILSVFLINLVLNIHQKNRKLIFRFAVYAFVVLFAIFSWAAFKGEHRLENENFNLSMVSLRGFFTGLSKLPNILYEYQKQFFGFKKWNIFWLIFSFLLIKERKTAFSGNIKYLAFAFFLFFAGYTLVYMFSAVEINFFLRKTTSRFLLHVLPLAVFWSALVFSRKYSWLPCVNKN